MSKNFCLKKLYWRSQRPSLNTVSENGKRDYLCGSGGEERRVEVIVMKYKWEGCWGFGFIVDEGRLEVYLFRLVIEVMIDKEARKKK